jgi:hypothetical protein
LTSRTCLFCGKDLQGCRSKEHIFPQWLQRHLGIHGQKLYSTLYSTSGEIASIREFNFSRLVSGLVCTECNNNWLSGIEVRTKPLLIPLIDGTFDGVLSYEKCHLITEWVYKTALTLNSVLQTGRVVPDEHYSALYKRRAIPAFVIVSAASFDGKDELFWIQNQNWLGRFDGVQPKELEQRFGKTYRIIMRFGKFMTRVHCWPYDDWTLFDYHTDGIRYLWPTNPKGVTWPPSRSIGDLQQLDESLSVINWL